MLLALLADIGRQNHRRTYRVWFPHISPDFYSSALEDVFDSLCHSSLILTSQHLWVAFVSQVATNDLSLNECDLYLFPRSRTAPHRLRSRAYLRLKWLKWLTFPAAQNASFASHASLPWRSWRSWRSWSFEPSSRESKVGKSEDLNGSKLRCQTNCSSEHIWTVYWNILEHSTHWMDISITLQYIIIYHTSSIMMINYHTYIYNYNIYIYYLFAIFAGLHTSIKNVDEAGRGALAQCPVDQSSSDWVRTVSICVHLS